MTPSPPHQFWREALVWLGSITPKVLPRVIYFGVYAWIISQISYAIESWLHFRLELQVDPFVVAGAALSLLLVLRTNVSYGRWWEARTLWGSIVNQCRNLAIDAKTYGPRDAVWQERFSRLLDVFPFTCKANLRDEALPEQVAKLVGSETSETISRAKQRPDYVALGLAQMLKEARQQGELDEFAFLQMDRERATLIDHFGDCERIVNTPLPKVCAIEVRRFIALFLLTLPLMFLHQFQAHWMIPLFTMIVAYPLLSLDEIGVELQNPFLEKNLSGMA